MSNDVTQYEQFFAFFHFDKKPAPPYMHVGQFITLNLINKVCAKFHRNPLQMQGNMRLQTCQFL